MREAIATVDGVSSLALQALGVLYGVLAASSAARLCRHLHIDKTAIRLFLLLAGGTSLRFVTSVSALTWLLVLQYADLGGLGDVSQLDAMVVYIFQLVGATSNLVLTAAFLVVFNTWATVVEEMATAERTHYHMNGVRAYGTESRIGNFSFIRSANEPQDVESLDESLHLLARSSSRVPVRVLFVRTVLLIYATHIGLFIYLEHRKDDGSVVPPTLFLVLSLLLTACEVLCLILLVIYGARMRALLGRLAEDTDKRQRNIHRIATVGALFCLSRLVALMAAVSALTSLPIPRDTTADSLDTLPPEDPVFKSAFSLEEWSFLDVVGIQTVTFAFEWTLLFSLLRVLPTAPKTHERRF